MQLLNIIINLFKADSQFQMDIDHCFFCQLDNVCTARLIYFADAENITVAWYFLTDSALKSALYILIFLVMINFC